MKIEMPKKNWIHSAIALLIGTAILVPIASIAEKVDVTRLDLLAKEELGKRYKRVGSSRFGSLEPQATIELSFKLRQGQKYGFIAVGDDNANDVDLQLLDEDGNILEEDVDADESAVIAYDPQQNMVYDLRVVMYNCQASECKYAVGAYRR